MNIVFLDIDGVLNNLGSVVACGIPSKHFDPVSVRLVAKLCENADAKIVVSSSWRNGDLQDLACAGISSRIIDETPHLLDIRGREIQAWLDEHEDKVTNYVILDDDSDMIAGQNFVQTTFQDGFRFEHYVRALRYLNPDHPDCDLRREKCEPCEPYCVRESGKLCEKTQRELDQKDAELEIRDEQINRKIKQLQAADAEIERLTTEVAHQRQAKENWMDQYETLRAECDEYKRLCTAMAPLQDRVETLSAESRVKDELIQRIMARLADLLEADQFNNIEALVIDAGVSYPELSAVSGRRTESDDDQVTRNHVHALHTFVSHGGRDLDKFAKQFPRTWNAIVRNDPTSFDLPDPAASMRDLSDSPEPIENDGNGSVDSKAGHKAMVTRVEKGQDSND